MAKRAGLLRNRLNERTLLSWAQTNESLRTADSSSPVIAVMQPAHALLANHYTLFQRAYPASRRLLVQPEVGSVVVIIGNVLGEESLQMALIQRDHVVEQVAAAASDPTLGDPILPGTPNRGTDRCHLQRAHRRWHFQSVLRIVVEQEKSGRGIVGKSFSQLLHDPGAGGMASDVEVHNAPAIMADDEEAVQNPKGESGDGEEIHGSNSFPMIAQKGQPALGGLRVLGRSFHPAGNGGFRHGEAEHEEFAMDARRTPTGIVSDHLKDQFTDLLGDPAATAHWIPHFAEHGPVQFEPGSMPAQTATTCPWMMGKRDFFSERFKLMIQQEPAAKETRAYQHGD